MRKFQSRRSGSNADLVSLPGMLFLLARAEVGEEGVVALIAYKSVHATGTRKPGRIGRTRKRGGEGCGEKTGTSRMKRI